MNVLKYYIKTLCTPTKVIKYFGKHIGEKNNLVECHAYRGGGLVWNKQIKKYGYENVNTQIIREFELTDTRIEQFGLKFSEEHDIVESPKWANLKPENGKDGWVYGVSHSQYTKDKISKSNMGRLTGRKRPTRSQKWCDNMSKAKLGEYNGQNNPNAKQINIYNSSDELQFSCNGDFGIICRSNSLPQKLLMYSHQNGGTPIYNTPQGIGKAIQYNREEFIGWYATEEKDPK